MTFGTPKRVTETRMVWTVPGRLIGFFITKDGGGKIELRCGNANDAPESELLAGPIEPAVGWHEFPIAFAKGLHVTLTGEGTDVTFVCV